MTPSERLQNAEENLKTFIKERNDNCLDSYNFYCIEQDYLWLISRIKVLEACIEKEINRCGIWHEGTKALAGEK